MRKLFRNIHLWLSVPFGLIIMLTCFSGAMLVFEKEMTEWARPEVFRVDPQGRHPLPVAGVVRRVSATLPEDITVTGVTVFSDSAKAWQLPLSQPSRMSVYADPYTGDVTGCSERLPFFAAMFRLHRWMLDSRPSGDGIFWGKLVVGVSTLLFVFVLLSGIVIWWPRTRKALRNSLQIHFRKGWRPFWYGLHVAGGMYALLLLLVMALTGLTWSFNWYRTGFSPPASSAWRHSHQAWGMATQLQGKRKVPKIATDKNSPMVRKKVIKLPIGRRYMIACELKIPVPLKSLSPTVRLAFLLIVSVTSALLTATLLILVPAN